MKKRASRIGEVPLLHELGATMRDASLCGLGQTASSAILRAMDKGLV
jgi:NADH-ubiquinone oxidoreductase-F iron-sulfur binding region